MDMIPVSSSNVESVGYDPEAKVLRVCFLNHTVYNYLDVPEPVFTKLVNASSVGSFLAKHIKPFFTAERLV